MDNFNLRTFLTENKLTGLSKLDEKKVNENIEAFSDTIQVVGYPKTVEDALKVIERYERDRDPVSREEAKDLVADMRATDDDDFDKNITNLIVKAFNIKLKGVKETVVEAKFPSFKTTEDGKVIDALTNAVYYDEGDTPEFLKLMDRALKEPQVAKAFGEYMKKNNIARKDLGDINVIKRTYSLFSQEIDKGSDEEIKNRVDAIQYFAGDDDRDWNSAVKDLADRALPKGPPAAPDISKLQKPQGPPPLPPKPGQ